VQDAPAFELTAPTGCSLSDVCDAAPNMHCDGCDNQADLAVEWEDDELGGRFWRHYCRRCGDVVLEPFRLNAAEDA